jgi:eukaryotic-like serine/threonine-protein kinase
LRREKQSRVDQLIEEALELEEQQRGVFLERHCGGDQSLRREVESFLAFGKDVTNFMETPALEVAAQALATEDPAPQGREENEQVRSIGPYQLLTKIGEGGMGQVWLAQQSAPLQRRVALKLIRGGMYDDTLLHRFQAERQSLAVMDHPSIAKVFDAGATSEGQPYFVMEYVSGIPITDYCDQRRMKIRDRLELFIKVCEGVQHAHQKAIIHRDLKPANILVVEIDGKPVPRIIDFGLAKATDARIARVSLHTQLGSFVGTPGYMSPEQCDPAVQDTDTRTDVYSLGVVLYVLLTGSLPLDTKEWKDKPFDEILRRLREEDPVRPSTKVSTDRGISSATADARGADPKQLVFLLRGDLDWITMKAVEKDRARRYGTPLELAADISRYLKNEPITARPASVAYRAHKYVRRHRYLMAGVGVVVALLVAFAVVQSIQLRRITHERDRADRIADFMTGIFKASDPNEKLGTITAQELLDKAAKDIATGLSKDPELQASMMHVIGRAYMYQGLFQKAQSVFEHGIRASTSAGLLERREAMNTMHDLAWASLQQGHVAEAEALERKLMEMQRRVLGADHPDTLATVGELAFTLCQRKDTCEEGVRLDQKVLEKQKRVLGPEHRYTLVTMDNLAIALAEAGSLAEAEKLQKESLEIHLRVFGPENLSTVNAMLNLGEFERDLGRFQDAKKQLTQALELEGRVLGPDQPETAATKYDLATVSAHDGQVEQALSLLRQAVDHGLTPLNALSMETDPLLNSLHGNPGFAALVAHVKERTIAAQKAD